MASRKEIDKTSELALDGTLPVNPFWTTDWGMVTVSVVEPADTPQDWPDTRIEAAVEKITRRADARLREPLVGMIAV
ncbi:MAG: hypothetical protein WA628_26730 [Terriglobales bacterium]